MSGNAGFNRLCRSLKNLGSLQQNERIWTEDGRIERYQTWIYLQGVVRSLYGQTKKENIRTVKEVVEQSLSVLEMCTKNELLYQRMRDTEARNLFTSPVLDRRRNYKRAQKLKDLLRNSIVGMNNLVTSTYKDDNICDDLEFLCEEIREKIDEVDVQCWRNIDEKDLFASVLNDVAIDEDIGSGGNLSVYQQTLPANSTSASHYFNEDISEEDESEEATTEIQRAPPLSSKKSVKTPTLTPYTN